MQSLNEIKSCLIFEGTQNLNVYYRGVDFMQYIFLEMK